MVGGKGPYTTNGAVVSMIKRSSSKQPEPDLFIFGLLGSFKGYFPGYSRCIAQEEDLFTWTILKAHTHNTCGQRDVAFQRSDGGAGDQLPLLRWRGGGDADLAAVVDGLKTARCINGRCREIIAEEVLPGHDVTTDDQIRRYIKDNAWGHHACGTCKMGPASDPLAVVDSRFRVHGLRNLRVVDASIFPKIPGFFIVSSVYMVSEKASDVIIEDANIGRIEM